MAAETVPQSAAVEIARERQREGKAAEKSVAAMSVDES